MAQMPYSTKASPFTFTPLLSSFLWESTERKGTGRLQPIKRQVTESLSPKYRQTHTQVHKTTVRRFRHKELLILSITITKYSMTKGREYALRLYRNILHAHKKYLPAEMRSLGDSYVKAEFKLHKNTTNTSQLNEFFQAWEQYHEQIISTARREESMAIGSLERSGGERTGLDDGGTFGSGFGQDLPAGMELSDEQTEQLAKLEAEARKVGNPSSFDDQK